MNERWKKFGDGFPKSLTSALRRASNVSMETENRIVLKFENDDNADAALEWIEQARRYSP